MIALRLLGSRVLGLLGRIPWQAWLAIVVALALFFGVRWHNGTVKTARNEGDKAGYARASNEFVEKMRKLETKANAIAAIARKQNDEEARIIADRADNIRVSGPGKASCPRAVSPSPARRPDAPGRATVPAVDQVSDRTGNDIIGLPFAATVAAGETCDLNRGEVLAWRDWHMKLTVRK